MTVHAMEIAYRTHVGLVRERNQDYLAALGELGVVVLGDGMGGHRAGEVASRLAVETAASELIPAQQADSADDMESLLRVGEAVEAANRIVYETAASEPEMDGMGTTLVAVVFREQRAFYAHVGDSRFYRERAGRIRRLTRDHSLVQQMIDSGLFRTRREAHEAGIGDNILTRSLGLHPEVEVDVGDTLLQPGDIYLVCSDGLCGRVTDDELARIMRHPGGDLEIIADQLLKSALSSGGRDNISFVLARPRDL